MSLFLDMSVPFLLHVCDISTLDVSLRAVVRFEHYWW
jgi:hypothetical protein